MLPKIDWLCYQLAKPEKMHIVPAKIVLRGGASGAKRCYVLARCRGGGGRVNLPTAF